MNLDKLDALTPPQRDCLRIYFASPNYKNVARDLNISVEAVKDRLERARRTLGVTDSHSAAYALAIAEGRVTPPGEGWPPLRGLTSLASLPPYEPLPKPVALAVAQVRENPAAAPFELEGAILPRGTSNDEVLHGRLPSLVARILRSAEIIALTLVSAWLAIAAINSLRPGFFRFLDNLHS